jgi:hypothetical protein
MYMLTVCVNCSFEKEFDGVQDVFELQVRSTCFGHRPGDDGGLLMRYQLSFDSYIDLTFTQFNGLIANASIPLQRNLNNCFAYDLVPSVQVLSAALKAARRVNDFPTAVRVFEGMRQPLQRKLSISQLRLIADTPYIGIKAKVESQDQYKQYLEELEGLRQELGVALREELYPQEE